MNYVEIHTVGVRTYNCSFTRMLAAIGLESISLRRTIRADIIDSDHNMYYVTCKYLKGTSGVEVHVQEL